MFRRRWRHHAGAIPRGEARGGQGSAVRPRYDPRPTSPHQPVSHCGRARIRGLALRPPGALRAPRASRRAIARFHSSRGEVARAIAPSHRVNWRIPRAPRAPRRAPRQRLQINPREKKNTAIELDRLTSPFPPVLPIPPQHRRARPRAGVQAPPTAGVPHGHRPQRVRGARRQRASGPSPGTAHPVEGSARVVIFPAIDPGRDPARRPRRRRRRHGRAGAAVRSERHRRLSPAPTARVDRRGSHPSHAGEIDDPSARV